MERIGSETVEAAETLGAPPMATFFKVVVPMSFSGVLIAAVMVFAGTISAYTTPTLLGGSKNMMLATLLYQQSDTLANWDAASLLSCVMILCSLGVMKLFDVVAAFLVVFFAQDRDDAAGVVHRDRMSGDFLKFFGQRRVQPRGDEAPLRVLGQVQEFRLAPDQPYVGPRRLIGIGRRVQHGHVPALAGKPVCQRGARYAPAYDDDILFCRAHGRMPPAAGLPPGPARGE